MKIRIMSTLLLMVISIVILHNAIPHHHHGYIPIRLIGPDHDLCDHQTERGKQTESCELSALSFTLSRAPGKIAGNAVSHGSFEILLPDVSSILSARSDIEVRVNCIRSPGLLPGFFSLPVGRAPPESRLLS